MDYHLSETPITVVGELTRVPIAFIVDRVLDVSPCDAGLGGMLLRERSLATPYTKDYDAVDGPASWARRFDTSPWAAVRGYRQLKIETQNINVPACRFYAARGCTLGSIDRHAYPGLPNEVRLCWYKELPAC